MVGIFAALPAKASVLSLSFCANYFESSQLADVVTVEPVSTPLFPANRERNREFRQIWPFDALRRIFEKSRIIRNIDAVEIRLYAMLEILIFYISPMYEFSHSLVRKPTKSG